MKSNKVKKYNKNLFYKIISVLLIVASIFFFSYLFYIDLLPIKYSIIMFIVVLIYNGLSIVLVNLKRLKKKIKKIISIFMIISILIMIIATFYLSKTLGVLLNNGDSKYKLEHYSVMVLKNSEYKKIKDIKGEVVGYFGNSTGAKDANNRLSEEVKVDFEEYKTSDTLVNDLLNSKVDVIIIEDSIKEIMEEEIEKFKTSSKVIYSFTIKTEVETTLKEVDVTKQSFAIYISGIDTYGEISSVSRSDVNMVMVVNPKTHQILLVSIPRDYYVQLHGTTGTKDKLTHAGIYGIDMSIQTIEDLLKLDINYYIKVNFTSVIDIVDALGGLDIYSEYTFTSYSGFRFKKGMNSVNGEQALDFARTRKAFSEGDRQRGKNQQAVIEALIRKATDKSIITKYNSLLNAINGKYQTNISMKKITSLIKKQLKDMKSWNVTSYSLTGSDSSNYTYTYNQLLYVMQPDEESVEDAIKLIDKVLNGEKLDNSYENITGTSNKVTKAPINVNKPSNNKDKQVPSKATQENTNTKLPEKNDIIDDNKSLDTSEESDNKQDNSDASEDSTVEESEDIDTSLPDIESDNSENEDLDIESPLDPILPIE